LQLTIATVPNAPVIPAPADRKWIYTDWRGAYDIARLRNTPTGVRDDYDQHTAGQCPGRLQAGLDVENSTMR